MRIDTKEGRPHRKAINSVGRPKKQAKFLPAGFHQAVRALFIRLALLHGSRALRLIATAVWPCEMTPKHWAELFNQSGTWLEQYADDALDFWRSYPQIGPESGNPLVYPGPRSESTAADVFSFATEAMPLSRIQHGITLGGDPSVIWQPAEDDETAFRRQIHQKLDAALDEYFQNAVASGTSIKIRIPTDLNFKIETTALYLLCDKSCRDLITLPKNPGFPNVEEDAMRKWLRETTTLLRLRSKSAKAS
jgi:hypothetical protein